MASTGHQTDRWLFLGLTLLSAIVISRGPNSLAGPAPHILAISHSILHDGDLDLANQYDPDGDYLFAPLIADATRRSGAAITTRGPRIVPTDNLGLALGLTVPLLVVEGAVWSVPRSVLERVRWDPVRATRDLLSLIMAAIAAWTAVLTRRWAARLGLPSRTTGLLVALAFATPPLVYASVLVGPEIPGALLVVWFALASFAERRTPWVGVPLAVLPWLDRGYVLIAVGGLLWLVVRARRRRPATGWTEGLRLAIAPLASMALLACVHWWLLDDVLPPRYPDPILTRVGLAGLPALLVDPDLGLFIAAPVWLVGLAGLGALHDRRPDAAWLAIGVCLATGAAATFSTPFVPAGSPVGLWIVPALPLFVPAVIAGLGVLGDARRRRWTRWVVAGACLWSVLMTAAVITRPARLWPSSEPSLSRSYAWMIDRWRAPGRARAALTAAGIEVDGDSLRDAVRAGDLDTVDALVTAGVEPAGALVIAAASNRTDALDLLLDGRVTDGAEGARALAWARYHRNRGAMQRLSAAGATPDGTNAAGESGLVVAAAVGARQEFPLLVATGLDVDSASRTGRTALMAAVERGDRNATLALLRLGANPDAGDRVGLTALHRAAFRGDLAIAAALIGAGADVNARSRLGWTPLMRGAAEGHVEMIGTLIDAGAEPDIVTMAGQTALVRAIQRGHPACVRALLRAGARPDLRVDGLDAWGWAQAEGEEAVRRALGERPVS